MCTGRFLLVLGLAVSASGLCNFGESAWAATDQERAGARSLATQAFDAYEKGEYERAIDLLERAESLVHAPAHWLYIGRSQEKLGRLVLAQEAYLKARREPLDEGSPAGFREAVSAASAALEALQPRIARITVQVTGIEPQEAVVTVDGTTVPSALVGVPMPVDPGVRQVTAAAPQMQSVSERIELAEGAERVVELHLAPDLTQPASTPPDQATVVGPEPLITTPTSSDREQPGSEATLLYVGVGAAVVGGVALGIGLNGLSNASEPEDRAQALYEACNQPRVGCSASQRRQIEAWDEEAAKKKGPAAAWLAVGATGIAAGATLLVLHFVQSSAPEAAPNVALRPWIGAQGVGISGTF